MTYTLDLATGLTQVLADGTNTYLYGNGRISQSPIPDSQLPEYFLGDALGSVRQLVDTNSAVTLTQSYAPYGEVTQSIGTSQSPYAFTGEIRDANGLTYLRARYYTPADGRFLSRDTWNGDYNRPLSLNRWGYVEGNPEYQFFGRNHNAFMYNGSMLHRHLTHQNFSLAAIDDVIARGKRPDWAELRQAVLKDQEVMKKVLRVCQAHVSDPYAQRYYFWKEYVERKLT